MQPKHACRDAQAETASGMRHRDGPPLDIPPCPFRHLADRLRLRNSTLGGPIITLTGVAEVLGRSLEEIVARKRYLRLSAAFSLLMKLRHSCHRWGLEALAFQPTATRSWPLGQLSRGRHQGITGCPVE